MAAHYTMASPRTRSSIPSFVCHFCRQSSQQPSRRAFTSSSPKPAEKENSSISDFLDDIKTFASPKTQMRPSQQTSSLGRFTSALDQKTNVDSMLPDNIHEQERPHRLHVYATKHNTHLTLTQHPRPAHETAGSGISGTSSSSAEQKKMIDMLMTLSAGNIGFRKAARGSYDAAYQLAGYMLKQIQEKGILGDIKKLEVVLRGFGAGREAVTKVLLGTEGRFIRRKISAVMDATRLKQGGVRGKKPRRLG